MLIIVSLRTFNNLVLHGLSYSAQLQAGTIVNVNDLHYIARSILKSLHTISCAHIATTFRDNQGAGEHRIISYDCVRHQSLEEGS